MGEFKGRSIISIKDFSREDLDLILNRAAHIKANPSNYSLIMKGKVLASLFFEPSTRTNLSFNSAMEKLGGSVIGFTGTSGTSVKKGESLADTVKTIDTYCDVIAMRHPLEGSARHVSEVVGVPVINGGDGANQHPTQTMLDLFTMREYKGNLNGLNVCLAGDLKYGRTVHSLAAALSLYNNTKFVFWAPDSLRMPSEVRKDLDANGVQYEEVERVEQLPADLDFVYATRIQAERFPDPIEYERAKNAYNISKKDLKFIKDAKVMHPLPRVNELSYDFDDTPNAIYFQQLANGIPVRQALMCLTTGVI
ncbi:MAG: aspartate carbamoyltransferase [Candidatus Diapherotrites archaeon]|nr:aspartate carbamoyltransferase [Candidatus Diapherotrites archaeon]